MVTPNQFKHFADEFTNKVTQAMNIIALNIQYGNNFNLPYGVYSGGEITYFAKKTIKVRPFRVVFRSGLYYHYKEDTLLEMRNHEKLYIVCRLANYNVEVLLSKGALSTDIILGKAVMNSNNTHIIGIDREIGDKVTVDSYLKLESV